MNFEFLSQFDKRMKSVGAYALLYKNSMQKGTWKQYGFSELYEQTNLTFVVLLYIMEQSLKDEVCTMDSIGNFIDTVNMRWFKKELSYEACKELGEFIVNTVLCDEGKAMYFRGFDFGAGEYKEVNISFIGNKIVYLEEEVRRTSYFLTNDGYSLMLSTLEIESNMKLTIHEMIFKMHLEKATYDKAVDDIKNIFNLLRIQLQKMHEAMRKIRQNALSYSVQDYKLLLEENLEALAQTKKKFDGYKEVVTDRVSELEQQDINIKKLGQKDAENLGFLKVIENYLNRAIDEQQKILLTHFDLKSLYTKELEDMSQMSLIKRFNIRSEFYDKVLENAHYMERLELLFRPLFHQPIKKRYNINKALQFQKPIRSKQIDEEEQLLSFDEEDWQEEQNKKMKEKLRLYRESLAVILHYANASGKGGVSLCEIKEQIGEDEDLLRKLIPTVEIFREVVIELLKVKIIDIKAIREEKATSLLEQSLDFQINESVLEVIDENATLKGLRYIAAYKLDDAATISFEVLQGENGKVKRVTCSNVYFEQQ